MTTKMGPYRYWGEQKPDTSRPLLTFSRAEAVAATVRTQPGDQPTSSGTLRIYGPIDSYGGWWGVSAKEVAQALDLLGDADQIVVRINSPGGESSEGRAIMNLLRAHKAKCVGVVDGTACSAASYIAVGCDETVMSPGTTLMIHDTHTFIYGDAAALRKEADVIDLMSLSGAELYADVAGGTADAWRELQRAETWYTATTAVEAGLADRVGVVQDAGPAETAGDTGPEPVDSGDVDDRARATYDLSLFEKAPPAGPTPKPPSASAVGSNKKEGAAVVDLNDEQISILRKQVGFPENADADTIVTATVEALNERAREDAPPAETAQVPEGKVLVSKAEWEETRGDAQRGAAAAKKLHDKERAEALNKHRDKFLPANRKSWEEEYDRNPKATVEALEKRSVVIPLDEIGHEVDTDTQGEASSLDEIRNDDNYKNWRM